MILDVHKEYWPSFMIAGYQTPLCIYTVLCLGQSKRDCAAYRGIGPDASSQDEFVRDALLNEIRKGGNKIPEDEARQLFDLTHEGNDLVYRR